MRVVLIFSLFLVGTGYTSDAHRQPAEVEVLVHGVSVPKHYHQGTTYLEAIEGKEYAIRITNPIGARVAVALSVDGLNTIDARHTDAGSARKWILGPYESIVISGWQTNARQARRFFFTTEERSYGTWLGQSENLGIISAVFFREKTHWAQRPIAEPPIIPLAPSRNSTSPPKEQTQADPAGLQSQRGETTAASPAPRPEYAATGIGDRIDHAVRWVQMNLEGRPFATVNLRYEFRPALVKLGVFPPPSINDSLIRRESAKGFRDMVFCPEP